MYLLKNSIFYLFVARDYLLLILFPTVLFYILSKLHPHCSKVKRNIMTYSERLLLALKVAISEATNITNSLLS